MISGTTEQQTEHPEPATHWLRRVGLFAAVGVVATVVHVAVAWLLVGVLPDLAANATGFVVALGVTYVGNYFLAFRSEGAHRETIIRFLVVSAVTLGMSEWILVFFRLMGAAQRASLLVAVVAIPVLRYAMLATQVFDDRRWTSAPLRQWLIDVAVWAAAPAIGILALLSMAPDGLLSPHSDLWTYPDGDRGVGVAGMRYFLADDWHWPLLRTDDLNAPDGTIVAFTDSLPILALPTKLARPLIGRDINYFPSWLLMAYSLQAIGGVVLLRSLRVRRPEALLAGATLAVTFPAFVFRSMHVALEGHFIILLTLAAAFSSGTGSDGTDQRRQRVFTAGGLVVALLIHPYLLVMTVPLVTGIYLDHWRRGRLSRAQVVGTGSGALASLGLVLVLGGYLGRYAQDLSYGQYGLNVLSPVYPQLSGLVPGEEGVLMVGASRWEGFNWLGFGALLLIAAALVVERRRLVGLVSRWRGLSIAAVALTALSVSQIVTVGNWAAIDLRDGLAWLRDRPLLMSALAVVVVAAGAAGGYRTLGAKAEGRRASLRLWLVVGSVVAVSAGVVMLASARDGEQLLPSLSIIRASGRLWWSVGLLLTLGAVAVVGRASPRRATASLLVVAAVLQVIDTGPVRQTARRSAGLTIAIPGIEQFREAADAADIVRVWPSFFCAAYPDGTFAVLDAIVVASAAHATPIDTAYTARPPADLRCGGPPPTTVPDGQLLVLVLPADRDPGELLTSDHQCRDNGVFLACTNRWAGLAADATSPFLPVVAEPVTFGQGGDSAAISDNRWGMPDPWGQVVPADGAGLAVPLLGAVDGQPLTLRMRIRSTTGEPARLTASGTSGPEQVFDVSGNDPVTVEFVVVAPARGPLLLTLRSDPTAALAGIDALTVVAS